MLEELVHHRYELPSFSTLERLAIPAREQVHDTHYRQITHALPPAMRAPIAAPTLPPPGRHHSLWPAPQREPKRPTNTECRHHLHHHPPLPSFSASLPTLPDPLPQP